MGILEAIVGPSALQTFRDGRRTWTARRARAVAVEEAIGGARQRVVGRVEPAEGTLTAPFTRRSVVVYVAEAQEKSVLGRESFAAPDGLATWVSLFRDCASAPFWLVGTTGARVRVELGYVRVVLGTTNVNGLPCFGSADVSPALDAYLRGHGVLPHGYMGIDGDHFFFEGGACPGDTISVYGSITAVDDVFSEGYRDAPRRVLCMRGTPEDALVILPA